MASARSPKKTHAGTKISTPPAKPFSHLLDFGIFKKDCRNQARSLLSMHYMLLGYNFKPKPTSHALDIAGSGMTKRMPLLEKPV